VKIKNDIPKACRERVDKVINYILKNMNDDLSLNTLSNIANYSPFHFQKLFKLIMDESPKQYIIRLRLETAIHLLLIHPHKSIFEISMDCGFSSPAVFSRAFKNYFGISSQEMRLSAFLKKSSHGKGGQFPFTHNSEEHSGKSTKRTDQIIIQIKKIEAITGIYLLAPFGDMPKIQKSFKEIMQLAETNDLMIDSSKICGILSPHERNNYKTFVAINTAQLIPDKFFVTEIRSGKYATFKVKGDFKNTIKAGEYFYHHWLPDSGYKIADILGFEMFAENPSKIIYEKIEREIFIPVEPIN
jgi:AraC family transcriptional regulator